MARGENKFTTMEQTFSLDADNPNAGLYKHNLEKPARDVEINGRPKAEAYELDPMKDLMVKGLVHHMDIPNDLRHRVVAKGLVKDAITEARYTEKNMRGKVEYGVMKGFEDVTVKGGTTAECLPENPGKDVAEDEKLHDKTKGKTEEGARTVEGDDLTFAKDVDKVGEKAKNDIADGYVSDIQSEKVSTAKGYAAYNEMVSKGMVADVEFNPHNVGATLDTLSAHSEMVAKELGDGIETKGALGRGLSRAGFGAAAALGNAKNAASKIGNKIASVPGAVNEAAGRVGSKVENTLRKANAKTTGMGASEGEGALGRAANIVGRNRKAVGYGLAGAGAAGVGGAAYGAKKATEDKCMGAPMKTKTVGGAFDEEEGPVVRKKEMSDTIATKGPGWESAKEGWRMTDQAVGGHLGRKIAATLAGHTAAGAGVGAGVAHLTSDEKGKKEGAWKRGARRGAIGGLIGGAPIGGAIGGYTARSTPAKRVARGESEEKD